MKKYYVTSKKGMTPFAWAATKKEAQNLAKQARRLGLDGQVRSAK